MFDKGIETRPIFYPIHKMPMYHNPKFEGDYPNADKISKYGISLPSYPELNEIKIKYICEKIEEFIYL